MVKAVSLACLAVAIFTTCCRGWETESQALQQAVKLLNDPSTFGVSTLSTQYPLHHPVTDLAGLLISGPEYFAPCYPRTGDLLYLGLTVSQTWKNLLNSDTKNATASIAFDPDPAVPDPRHLDGPGVDRWKKDRPLWRRGMPSKGRATLFGHFEIINTTAQSELAEDLSACYLSHHPDARHWAPNSTDSPHVPFWAHFIVNRVYWVGGFGDEHYIGWFNQSEWQTAWQNSHAAFNALRSKQQATVSLLSTDRDRPHLADAYATMFGEQDRLDLNHLVFQ